MKKCIILNKVFNGEWLNQENNIAHEIVNFFLTDNNEYYVYNSPHGDCNDQIWINNTNETLRTGKEKYNAKYLVLTDKFTNKTLRINYVIELDKKLHNFQNYKNKLLKSKIYEKNKNLINILNIKYGNKYLYEAFNKEDQTAIQITFKAKKIYKSKQNIEILLTNYNFARVRGYIYEDKFQDDYSKIINEIETSIKNNFLEEIKLDKLKNDQSNFTKQKTFIDLAMINDNEQIFTNIFYQILKFQNVFDKFYKKFIGKNASSNFNVEREVITTNKKGRMDIYAENDEEVIIIENKINSLLNGVDIEESKTQLDEYYKHAELKKKNFHLFLLVINSKLENINRDIKQKNSEMDGKWRIISYREMMQFIKELIDCKILNENFEYFKYLEDIVNALQKYSLNLLELYSIMFCNAIYNKK